MNWTKSTDGERPLLPRCAPLDRLPASYSIEKKRGKTEIEGRRERQEKSGKGENERKRKGKERGRRGEEGREGEERRKGEERQKKGQRKAGQRAKKEKSVRKRLGIDTGSLVLGSSMSLLTITPLVSLEHEVFQQLVVAAAQATVTFPNVALAFVV